MVLAVGGCRKVKEFFLHEVVVKVSFAFSNSTSFFQNDKIVGRTDIYPIVIPPK